jgi:hypothetical protein
VTKVRHHIYSPDYPWLTLETIVYNYWEPLHYLVRGKGFQTWEYSPEYRIRSWFYIFLHSGPAFLARKFPDKVRLPLCAVNKGNTEKVV